MRQSIRPPVVALFLGGGLAMAAAIAACGGSVPAVPLVPTVSTITSLPSDAEMLSEKTQGNASAQNTIVEYLSFASTTSRTFYLTGDGVQIKSQLADTGRAQIIFRSLFTNNELLGSTGKPVAGMLARCVGNARFFDAVTTLFQNQASWVNNPNQDVAAEQVMLAFGMSQALINSCLADTTLFNGLGQVQTTALQATYTLPDGTQRAPTSTLGSIRAVPALVVNGVLFDGMAADGATANPAFAPTLANIQAALKQ